MHNSIILFAVIILLYFNSYSQSIKWNNYTSQNSGLPDNRVWSIVVDNNNNKWFGTSGGLVKFDGQRWTTYNMNNSSLPSNYITCLDGNEIGTLWIGTSKGLVSYDGTNWKVFNPANSSIPDTFITAIKATKNGIWVGAMNWTTIIEGGLGYYDGTNWTVYNHGNSPLPDNRIASIYISSDSTMWAGTLRGLAKYYNNEWKIYQLSNVPGVNINDIEAISNDSKNTLWLASKAYPMLWGGIIEGGLVKLIDTSFIVFNNQNSSFPNNANSVNYVYVDKFDNIWTALWYQNPDDIYGTWGVALAKFDGKSEWKFYDNELISQRVTSIVMDKSNHLWIGTEYGLTEMIDTTLTDIKENSFRYDYHLFQNYPNPFNPTTKIKYSIPNSEKVIIKVYDVLGKEIKTLLNEYKSAGIYEIGFNGNSFSSGIYFYKITCGNYTEVKKMVLVR